jgi:hypothetical protein
MARSQVADVVSRRARLGLAQPTMLCDRRDSVWMGLTLREVRDEDLPLLFEQWADPVAVQMAAFTAPDHMDWDAFERRCRGYEPTRRCSPGSSSSTTSSPERSGTGASPVSAR